MDFGRVFVDAMTSRASEVAGSTAGRTKIGTVVRIDRTVVPHEYDIQPLGGGVTLPQEAFLWSNDALITREKWDEGDTVVLSLVDDGQYIVHDVLDRDSVIRDGGKPSDASPLMDGAADAGVSEEYARGDHVHPTDTSRATRIDHPAWSVPARWQDGAGEAVDALYPSDTNLPNCIVIRDGGGRFEATDPIADKQVATKKYVDDNAGGTPPTPSSSSPLMDGTAAAGSSVEYARGDHRHPSDTSRVAKAGDAMSGALSVQYGGGETQLSNAYCLIKHTADAHWKASLGPYGFSFGSGAAAADWELNRTGANVASLAAGDQLRVQQDPSNANDLARKSYVDTKAPIASPAFTGTPTAPTPAANDNSTRVATTAWVTGEFGKYVPKSLYGAKGAILAASGAGTPVAVSAPANNWEGLVSDSSQSAGVAWFNLVGLVKPRQTIHMTSVTDVYQYWHTLYPWWRVCRATCVGGGGRGGDARTTQGGCGGGGAGGACAVGYYTRGQVGELEVRITVGFGDSGGLGAGGPSAVGIVPIGAGPIFDTIIANGGGSGNDYGTGSSTGGSGGTYEGTNVAFGVNGGRGGHGALTANVPLGFGGDSGMGWGGGGSRALFGGSGGAGTGYGGGGGGAYRNTSDRTGGAGAAGMVLLEFYG